MSRRRGPCPAPGAINYGAQDAIASGDPSKSFTRFTNSPSGSPERLAERLAERLPERQGEREPRTYARETIAPDAFLISRIFVQSPSLSLSSPSRPAAEIENIANAPCVVISGV